MALTHGTLMRFPGRTIARLKLKTQGRFLWLRTISSTVAGQGIDSLLFITLAFGGLMEVSVLTWAVLSGWGFKSIYEAVATPMTYLIVRWLKAAEGIEHFDRFDRPSLWG